MSVYETPAVQAERERRETQHAVWENVREAATHFLDTTGRNQWITTKEFVTHLQQETKVSRGVAIAVVHEFKENGYVVYSLGEGYCHPEADFNTEVPVIPQRIEDLKRRNNFLSFVDAMYKISNK